MPNFHNSIALDELDLAILRQVQVDCSISNSELARRICLSQPATHTRLKRLREAGIIRQSVSLLDRAKLGMNLSCFIQIQLNAHDPAVFENFQQFIKQMPEVLECHYLTGASDYLLKVVLTDQEHLGRFVREQLAALQNVRQITTSVVMFEVKSTTVLPLPNVKLS